DYARRSVAASGAAIQAAQAAAAAKATADAAARQQAQVQALQQQAAASEQKAAETAAAAEAARQQAAQAEQARAEAAAQAAQNQAERDALAAERDRMQKERDAMVNNLVASLSKIADTRRTARGIVVTLPGSYFGPNDELTAAAKSAVSRLASTALLSPENTLRIEGHSDTGPDEAARLEFSQRRAKAVYDFLAQDGEPTDRMTYEGYGSQFPVASNVSEEGRAVNRRVEVIVGRGVIMDAKTFAQTQGHQGN
ncbi:MAG TPA: OmpA family protein, partial [Thermoanaerobaculia bacterium]|nr:OmpA family protein [Thermoanaerobaculia bacterium]